MRAANSSFFTQRSASRYVVPHTRLGERWMLVIHAAVTAAFQRLRGLDDFDLRAASENAVSNKLEEILRNDLMNSGTVEGFDKLFFGPVTRGSEIENFSGLKISKKPDLVFHLQRENSLWDLRQDAVFAECKPVDRAHSLATNYCATGTDRVGVERFVIGDYAWAMHEAFMIGFVRDNFLIHPHLAESLAVSQRHTLLGSPTVPTPILSSADTPQSERLHRTDHLRNFTWKENGEKATSIALYHSWHLCE